MGSGFAKQTIAEQLEKLKADLETRNDLFHLIEQTVQKLNSLTNVRLNIAITGSSGAGKSSLVNGLLGIEDFDEGAAEIGVTETDILPKGYPHPTFPNVTIWDLPGFGAVKFKANEYSQLINIMDYDFFIIVTSVRFTENDLLLAQEIHKMKKKFYFVRTKLDADIASESRKQNFCEKDTLEKIREYCCTYVKEGVESPPKVFLVSSRYRDRYDFHSLLQDIENELDEIKRYVLLTAFSNKSKRILKKKKSAMQALVSAASGAATVPYPYIYCDYPFVESIMCDFSKIFGLDEDSLHRLANQVGKPVDVLSSAIKKTKIASQINGEFVKSLLSRVCKEKGINLGGQILYYMFSSDRLLRENQAIISLTLKHFLDDAEEDAVNVMAKAFEN